MQTDAGIYLVRPTVGADEACRAVRAATGLAALNAEPLLYPYFAYAADAAVPGARRSRPMRFACLVDAINGHAATADAYDIVPAGQADGPALAPEFDPGAAARAAERTVAHLLRRKLRMLAEFGIRIEARGIVHKRFWIVDCGTCRVMVDSVTGGLYPLPARAA